MICAGSALPMVFKSPKPLFSLAPASFKLPAHGFCCFVIKYRTQFSFFDEPDNGCHDRPRRARADATFASCTPEGGTLDVDQWPALRGRPDEAYGPTAHEECSCHASSFIS
jgi:hypothetical protein